VPSYLKKVPDDPFGLHAPLRYKKTITGYLLYSIGPDDKDNGGKPIFNTKDKYSVGPESIGDIVADVNN